MDLPGTVAVVTGGAVRIGRVLTLALAEAGCDVCIHYGTSDAAAAETAGKARESGVRAITVQADLAEPESAAEIVFAAATSQLGNVDVLINNASIFEPGMLQTTDADNWDRHFDINLKSPFCFCRRFAELHDAARLGQIVNLADWRAVRPPVGHLAYTITKAGLVTMTKILAQELAPAIQVNAVAPGAILPPAGVDVNEYQKITEDIPLRRTGEPADVAAAMLYLLRSDFVTGEVLHVTGGQQL